MKCIPLAVLTLGLTTTALPAHAGFFGIINEIESTVRDVNRTINSTQRTIENIGYTVGEFEELTGSLGISSDSVDLSAAESGDDVAISLYQSWYNTLSNTEKATVDQLAVDYATGGRISTTTLSSSDWFQVLSPQEKQSTLGLYAKFNQIVDLVDDRDSFVAGIWG